MIEYTLLPGGIGLIQRRGAVSTGKTLQIALPREGTVYVNGHPYVAKEGIAAVPVTALSCHNAVRAVDTSGSYRCEGFAFDGEKATPAGPDTAEALAAIAKQIVILTARVGEAEEYMKTQKRLSEGGLFD